MTRKLSAISLIILLISLFAANPARAAKSYYALWLVNLKFRKESTE